MEPKDKKQYEAGRKYARTFKRSDIDSISDDLVLGSFDVMDWFEDKPDKFFLAGFKKEIMELSYE